MKIKIILIIILVIFLIILHVNQKEKFMKRDIYSIAYNIGIDYLNSIVVPYKGAVMFDIDDTLLEVRNHKQNKITFRAIKPMINLLNECINNGLLVIIITARDNEGKQQTINDLAKYKINYSALYCRHSPKQNYENFKSDIKEHLFKDFDIKILLSVGDNWIDIVGNYSGFCIKLPNKSDPSLYYGPNVKNLTKI
jgi:predicted secreted acid phosphatase